MELNWTHYDFKTLFGKGSISENVRKRTKNLFYVCITRAKKNLIVYVPNDNLEMIEQAKGYFGEKNVYNIKELVRKELSVNI